MGNFKPPSVEAQDYADAIMSAIAGVSRAHVDQGKQTMFADPMSALVGVLASFLAGMPETVRVKALIDVAELLKIGIEQTIEAGSAQRVFAMPANKNEMQ